MEAKHRELVDAYTELTNAKHSNQMLRFQLDEAIRARGRAEMRMTTAVNALQAYKALRGELPANYQPR